MIVLKDIRLSFGDTVVFDGFSESFFKNSINCIVGPSGCGKTTLLNILAGLQTPDGGDAEGVPQKVSSVFQEHRLIPQKTVRQNLDFALQPSFPDKKERRSLIGHYLDMMELSGAADLYPVQLSGGMAQRISLARAFACPSGLLLLDEPFKALDMRIRDSIRAAFLRMWEKDRRTVLFVTHDIDEAVMSADFIFLYSDKPMRRLERYALPTGKSARKLYHPELADIKNSILRRAEAWQKDGEGQRDGV